MSLKDSVFHIPLSQEMTSRTKQKEDKISHVRMLSCSVAALVTFDFPNILTDPA